RAMTCRPPSATPARLPPSPRHGRAPKRLRRAPQRSRRSWPPGATTMLPGGYSARPARLEDAAAVAAVIGLCQLAAFGAAEIDESEVRDDWAGVDMASDTLVIEREGEPRAFADLVIRLGQVSVYGYVHPAETGRGLGSYLTAWGEQRALAEAAASSEPIVVRHYVVSTNRAATRLLEER